MLLANAGRVLPRDTLIDRVWGSDYVGDTKTLDVHVKRLRSKIEPDPANPTRIVTIRGLGYKYERVYVSLGDRRLPSEVAGAGSAARALRPGPPRVQNAIQHERRADAKFRRLSITHAAMMGGDAAMLVALADSLFLSIDPSAARSGCCCSCRQLRPVPVHRPADRPGHRPRGRRPAHRHPARRRGAGSCWPC